MHGSGSPVVEWGRRRCTAATTTYHSIIVPMHLTSIRENDRVPQYPWCPREQWWCKEHSRQVSWTNPSSSVSIASHWAKIVDVDGIWTSHISTEQPSSLPIPPDSYCPLKLCMRCPKTVVETTFFLELFTFINVFVCYTDVHLFHYLCFDVLPS